MGLVIRIVDDSTKAAGTSGEGDARPREDSLCGESLCGESVHGPRRIMELVTAMFIQAPRRTDLVVNELNLLYRLHPLTAAPALEDCTLQLSTNGNYLDIELSLAEQRDYLEAFFEDISRGRRPTLILRTQLSVRVHAILEKLYNSNGPELRRSLFSLKQLFQEDKDLVPEFVNSEGLTCLIKVGAEADQNYQNYILRALSQIMLFVDGMNGVINHNETVQWLYTLCGSPYRLVVKTALKLLIVFVEYTESNAPLLIRAVNTVDHSRGTNPWSNLIDILEEKNGADSELLVFAMTLINKVSERRWPCTEHVRSHDAMHGHGSSEGVLSQKDHKYQKANRGFR
ncbi:LOW QUALITY PROTEIN: FH1/FH2 domain-containing protein 1-like [Anomaloglossus baeobatrachus]|uniref:LOW QUALITY PROTEIN: FH1/FH2 domain-containing protein 1-like n=1 Tax=Anomaloglossus baeobatrachus TaxID=238106 RepID=UPI003F4FBA60